MPSPQGDAAHERGTDPIDQPERASDEQDFDFWRDVIGDDIVFDGVVYGRSEYTLEAGGIRSLTPAERALYWAHALHPGEPDHPDRIAAEQARTAEVEAQSIVEERAARDREAAEAEDRRIAGPEGIAPDHRLDETTGDDLDLQHHAAFPNRPSVTPPLTRPASADSARHHTVAGPPVVRGDGRLER